MFTGIKDLDLEILKHVKDRNLLKICSINKKMWNLVCDDNFLRKRLLKYPNIEQYKSEDESWKDFYSRAVYIIAEMFRKYKFLYIKGDFIKQYKLLKTYKGETMGMLECLLVEASKEGELELVKYALKNGANIHAQYEGALTWGSFNGHLEVMKYLVQQGANIHAKGDYPLHLASQNGHLEAVKYLLEQGSKESL